MVLNEAPDEEIETPPGFPTCNNFYNDRSRDMQFIATNYCKCIVIQRDTTVLYVDRRLLNHFLSTFMGLIFTKLP